MWGTGEIASVDNYHKLLSSDSEVNVCVCFSLCMWSDCCYLTLSEAWRVVIHIRQGDVDHGGPSQAPSLPSHVFGFDHHLVIFPLLPVHVTRTQSCPDNACQNRCRHTFECCSSSDKTGCRSNVWIL